MRPGRRRRPGALAGTLALLVAGCAAGAPAPVPPDAAPPPPVRTWVPDGPPAAVIVALHGFNDYGAAFAGFGAYAAKRGIAVRAYDQRGFGSNPDAGFWPGTEVLVGDLVEALKAARAAHPAAPLFVLGESMGAAVTITTLAGSAGRRLVDGAILSAPAVWGGDQLNPLYRAVLWTANQVAPGYRLTGEGLDVRPTDNREVLIALGQDPLVIKATRVDAIAGLVDLMDRAVASVPEVDGPLLILKGVHDEIVPPKSQEALVARLTAEPCTVVTYTEGYHLLLRDLQREVVWRDILAWIDGVRDLPSGLAEPCGGATRSAAGDASRAGS
jgi:alpha-beta hydrolase superfamily lysophospholipase